MADSSPAADQEETLTEAEILHGIVNLASSLQRLDDQSSVPLSHYRRIPPTIEAAYQILTQGAQLVHSTSTKYSLMGKISREQQTSVAADLLKGCQLLSTSAVVLHQPSSGAAPALRHAVKQATRAVLATVVQLLESFADESALEANVGAQKTGAVWATCNVLVEHQLPKGNRNAMRRELFTFVSECNETLTEFQDMIDQGARDMDAEAEHESSWDDFLQGDTDQYTAAELPSATAGLALIKCSRGSLNALLKACEAVGQQLPEADADQRVSDVDRLLLQWILSAHELGRAVGQGMTDLGTTMYPPLQSEPLLSAVEQQATRIQALLQFLADATLEGGHERLELGEEVADLVSKLLLAVQKRQTEATDAIAALTGAQ